MKIIDLYISGFGKFHNRTITFHDKLNIVYGRNEAGKSTIHTFIRGMLFGIEKQRGRASKNDLYGRFEPWENSGTYQGRLRFESEGTIYRIERNFQKNNKEFSLINESTGKKIEPAGEMLNQLLFGLSETAYNNTISIGQLKSATEAGMTAELKNYIANLNTSGNLSLDITKAVNYLKNKRKQLEASYEPSVEENYTTILTEIQKIEAELNSESYNSQITALLEQREANKLAIEEKTACRDQLTEKIRNGQKALATYSLKDIDNISSLENNIQLLYEDYQFYNNLLNTKSAKSTTIFTVLCSIAFLLLAGISYYIDNLITCGLFVGIGILTYLWGLLSNKNQKRLYRDYNAVTLKLRDTFLKYIGNSSVSEENYFKFFEKLDEFKILCDMLERSTISSSRLLEDIMSLQEKQTTISETVEQQQRIQWDYEQKLESLDSAKTKLISLENKLASNRCLHEEIIALDLAISTMSEISHTIRDSFGLYLNQTASKLIKGITGGRYTSISVDENLNVSLNTPHKLVSIEQVSSGTADQVYLALRLAVAKLMGDGTEPMPLIFDDSFVLYDDERLKTVLNWIDHAYKGQIILFTCHTRELHLLNELNIPFYNASLSAIESNV